MSHPFTHVVQRVLEHGFKTAEKHPATAIFTALVVGGLGIASGGIVPGAIGLFLGVSTGGVIGEVVDTIKKSFK